MANGKWANPGPAGSMVLAFYLGCLWPVATGLAPKELVFLLIPLGLAGAVVQTTAGVIELRNGAILPGNVLLAFSAFMWYGFGEKLLQALRIVGHDTAAVDGWVFLIMGLLMTGFTPGFFLANTAAALFMVATDVFFLSAALSWLLGSWFLWAVAGWSLPFVIIFIIWQAIGDILNAHFGRPIIWMGPPLIKRQ
ncbi:MAG: uncharacterized protein PWQ18_1251 [Clostridia bacterium]|nr:uncharacterized protein [Clostridia bacterium]